MAEDATAPAGEPRLTGSGIARIVTVLATQLVQAAVFFGAAGRIEVARAWIYYGRRSR